MIKCPDCGSTAQPKLIDVNFEGDDREANCYRTYICGCGCKFITVQTYKSLNEEQIIIEKH